MVASREKNRDMILHPMRWPNLVLPLKRGNDLAVFAPPVGISFVRDDMPIEILIGNMFMPLNSLPTKTYTDVDALLDDGWVVD